jgi:WD40 repeat protein
VTQGLDGTPLLWPVTSNGPAAPAVTLKEHSKSVASVAFSPDGRWLVTGGYDESARRWDLKAKDVGASSHLLASFSSGANVVTFSEDSRRVLASGGDAAYLWELGEDDAWPPPIELPAKIWGGSFSRDGRWLVTSSHDTRTVSVWSLKLDELMSLACRTAARNLTKTEWDKYFPGQAYTKTCPDRP